MAPTDIRNMAVWGVPLELSPWSYKLNIYSSIKYSLHTTQTCLRDTYIKTSQGRQIGRGEGRREERSAETGVMHAAHSSLCSWERGGLKLQLHSLWPWAILQSNQHIILLNPTDRGRDTGAKTEHRAVTTMWSNSQPLLAGSKHSHGVWSLPPTLTELAFPTLSHCEQWAQEKHVAESD